MKFQLLRCNVYDSMIDVYHIRLCLSIQLTKKLFSLYYQNKLYTYINYKEHSGKTTRIRGFKNDSIFIKVQNHTDFYHGIYIHLSMV